MKAEIIATGTELLLGEIIDLNSPYLAQQLSALGIDLYWISTVGDNKARLIEALQHSWARTDLTITTGGLGPTPGDITREAVAQLLGETLQVDPSEEARLRHFFSSRSLEMPQSNLKQAMYIPSARFLPNPRGTAPGWWVEKDGHTLVTLPGPPNEASQIWENQVVPKLKERLGGVIILSRVLKTATISEARVGELLSHLVSRANPSLATYAKSDGIHLRITTKAQSEDAARRMLQSVEAEVKAILGGSVWGYDSDTLESVIGKLLLDRGFTLATMESFTAGLLAAAMTNIPGSSAYFRGGIVSYSNEVKAAAGVDPSLIEAYGAVSPEVAQAMATAVRTKLGATVGISITGVAGPSHLEGKPPGTAYIGIDDGLSRHVVSRLYPGNRQMIRGRAVTGALFELYKTLSGG